MASVWIKARDLETGGRSYDIYYKDPETGKTLHFKTVRKRGIADRLANQLRTFIDGGDWAQIATVKQDFRPMTLRQCSANALENFKTKVEKGSRSNKTLSFHEEQHKVVLREFGNLLVMEISTDMVEEYLAGVAGNKGRSRGKTGDQKLFVRTANARLFALRMMAQGRIEKAGDYR